MLPYHILTYQPVDAARAEIVAHLDAGGSPRAHDNAALRWACWTGHLDILERLLSLGLTAADVRADRNEALVWACARGHLAILERLLGLGLTADDARANYNEALRMACLNGHLAVLERLISLGLTADDARTHYNYAMQMASYKGHLAVVERLIELGLTLADARAGNNLALHYACGRSHHAVAARLLELGVEPTPNALVLCGAGRQDDADEEWPHRLWRALDRWVGSQELAVAESKLTPPQHEAWEAAKARAHPSRLRFSD